MKTLKKLVWIFPFLLSLISCSASSGLSFSAFSYGSVSKVESKHEIHNAVYDQSLTYSDYTYYNVNNEKSEADYTSLLPYQNGLTTIGEARLLVIPVSLSTSNKDTTSQKNKRIALQNAFFGSKDKNQYYSLAEYYQRSSYGNLSIKGAVTAWVNYDEAIDSSLLPSKMSEKILAYALKTIAGNEEDYFSGTGYSHLSDFLHAGTDRLDGVFLVYDAPISSSSSLYWAFTNRTEPSTSTLIPGTSIHYAYYAWASTDYMNIQSGLADSRTYIHEVGHLLGLEDYYNTSGSYQPTGSMDMMDTNLGDENSYSKMILNWTTPKVVKGKGEVTLSDFSNSGDVLLIPLNSTYSNTPIDDYLLIEYFTPAGLNNLIGTSYQKQDAMGKEYTFTYLSTYGVKVYEVHSSLAYCTSDRLHIYIRNIEDSGAVSGNVTIDYVNHNSGAVRKENALISLLSKKAMDTPNSGVPFTNEDIYLVGDTVDLTGYSLSTLTKVNVKKVTASGVTLVLS